MDEKKIEDQKNVVFWVDEKKLGHCWNIKSFDVFKRIYSN